MALALTIAKLKRPQSLSLNKPKELAQKEQIQQDFLKRLHVMRNNKALIDEAVLRRQSVKLVEKLVSLCLLIPWSYGQFFKCAWIIIKKLIDWKNLYMINRTWSGQESFIEYINQSLIPQCNAKFNIKLPSLEERGICHLLSQQWIESFDGKIPNKFFQSMNEILDPNTDLSAIVTTLKQVIFPKLEDISVYSYSDEPSFKSDLTSLLDIHLKNNSGLAISSSYHTQAIFSYANKIIVFDPNETELTSEELKVGGKIFDSINAAAEYVLMRFRLANTIDPLLTLSIPQRVADNTQLHEAITFGETARVKDLAQRSSLINLPDHSEKTPLHYAIMYDRLDYVELLLTQGADKNIRAQGDTPLMLAAALSGDLVPNSSEILKLLCKDETGPHIEEALNNALINGNYFAAKILVEQLLRVQSDPKKVLELNTTLLSYYFATLREENFDLQLEEIAIQAFIHMSADKTPPASAKLNEIIASLDDNKKFLFGKTLLEGYLQFHDDDPQYAELVTPALQLLLDSAKHGNVRSFDELLYFGQSALSLNNRDVLLKVSDALKESLQITQCSPKQNKSDFGTSLNFFGQTSGGTIEKEIHDVIDLINSKLNNFLVL